MDASGRDWASVPAHIMDLMVIKLDSLSDYVRFCGVCPQWRYVAHEGNVDHKVNLEVLNASHKKIPMLMFKTCDNNDETRMLYSVSEGKTYTLKFPVPYKNIFVGSSMGWLFSLEKNFEVTLVNPYTNVFISLPVLKNPHSQVPDWFREPDLYIKKGILLSDPHANPNSFIVVVIYDSIKTLAFFKSGEKSWDFIESAISVEDIIYHKGKLCGVDNHGQFFHVDLPSKTTKTVTPVSGFSNQKVYLVELQGGELFMVKTSWATLEEIYEHSEDLEIEVSGNEEDHEIQSYDSESEASDCNSEFSLGSDDTSISSNFQVFKLTHLEEEESPTWVEIKNIDQQALLVGDTYSVSISTTELPGCWPNSIYEIQPSSDHVFSFSSMDTQKPMWFMPSLQGINHD